MKKISALLFTLLLNQGCGGGGGSNDPAPGTYGVSGNISGLAGEITLSLNGTRETFTENGSFNFETRVTDGENYQVTVANTPTGLTCGLTNQAGQSEQNISNVTVTCSGLTPTAYNLSGLAFNTESPSIVTFAFHLVDRFTGLAIDNLDAENVTDYLKVLENGANVSPSESFLELSQLTGVNAEYNTVFAIDVSSSLSIDALDEIKRLVKETVYNEQTDESRLAANQYVSLLTFSSTVDTLVTKTQDVDDILQALESISTGGNSTNLYGAIEQGSKLWENEISLDLLSYGNLILFTDGNHTSNNDTTAKALQAAEGKDIYFLAIGDEVDTNVLEEFTHANNIFTVADFEQLAQSLDNAFTRVKTYEDGLYIMSYATPKRAGDNTLTVSAIDDYRCDTAISEYEETQINSSGNINSCADEHSYEFDADNFTDIEATLELTGPSFTTSPEASLQSALRWSHNTPEFDWQIKVCSGNVTETRSDDLSSITFTRNTNALAVIDIRVVENVSFQSQTQYLVLAKNSTDGRYLTQNTLNDICNN